MKWGILGELGLAPIVLGVGFLAMPVWRSWSVKLRWWIAGGVAASLIVVGLVFLVMPVWRYQYDIEKPNRRIDRFTGERQCFHPGSPGSVRVIKDISDIPYNPGTAKSLIYQIQRGRVKFENLSIEDQLIMQKWQVLNTPPSTAKQQGIPSPQEWEDSVRSRFPITIEEPYAPDMWERC
jgi:hypothetical protein